MLAIYSPRLFLQSCDAEALVTLLDSLYDKLHCSLRMDGCRAKGNAVYKSRIIPGHSAEY
jgi:hypothetical protein